MSNNRTFFDIHLHAFNLSHAGIMIFLNRYFLNNALTFEDLLNGRFRKIIFKVMFRPKPLKSLAANFFSLFIKILLILIIVILVGWIAFALLLLILNGIFNVNFLSLTTWQYSAILIVALSDIIFITVAGLIIWLIIKKKIRTSVRRTINVLSVFENDLARQFQYLELDYLRLCKNEELIKLIQSRPNKINFREFNREIKELWNKSEKQIYINNKPFNKVILTPLMMDFGYKGFEGLDKNKIHYYLAPRKQIKDQGIDLFNGIKQYYDYSPVKLFEIYPFMAINTANLEMGDEPEQKFSKTLPEILETFFRHFECESFNKRYERLNKKREKFLSDKNYIDSENYYYAGIKIYPPLGYNPWPDNPTEKRKVEFLYDFCQKRCIPITTHCSDGGFVVIPQKTAWEYTKPERWNKVLEHFPELKLNFAHAGVQAYSKTRKWLENILILVNKYDNVYFDISYNGVETKYYESIAEYILKVCKSNNLDIEKIKQKILFGSDFMVNLFDINSYHKYLELYSQTKGFDQHFVKDDFCTVNAERFLFEGINS